MVKLRIVCPCGGGATGPGRGRPTPPPLRRNSSLSSQAQSNLARYFSVAFFVFAATTYLVFSLDMLMVPEDEPVSLVPRRRMEEMESEKDYFLRSNPKQLGDSSSNTRRSVFDIASEENGLIVMEEEDLEAMNLEKQHAETDATVQQRASKASVPASFEDDFADGLNSIGLAMLDDHKPGKSNPGARNAPSLEASADLPIAVTDRRTPSTQNSNLIKDNPIIKTNGNVEISPAAAVPTPEEEDDEMEDPPQPSEEDEEEEEEIATTPTLKPDAQPAVIASASEWRRIHICKYGRSEKSPTLAYGTWIWRHKKGAVLHEDYMKTPTDSKLRHLKEALHMVSDNVMDIKSVVTAASEAGYTLCRIDLETSMVIAWQPRLRGDALFFTRHAVSATTAADAIRPVIVEVPHALYDHTLHQGLHVFTETKAKALILSESHRCSKALSNKCTGNEGEPVRNLCYSSKSASASVFHNSDAAHAVQTTFHAAHEQLVEDSPHALIASLHATKAEEFIVSDGTSNTVTETSPIVLFSRKLAANVHETEVNLCNDYSAFAASIQAKNLAPVPEDKRHICGATNVQGRHMNGATDPCRAKVHRNGQELQASGKFLHIEQPVQLVMPIDSKSTKPVMSKPLSEAILAALEGL